MNVPSTPSASKLDDAQRSSVCLTADRFGCGARTDDERRACGLYLWLLGPTEQQLRTDCPCRG